MEKRKKFGIRRALGIILLIGCIGLTSLLGVNLYVKTSVKDRIITAEEAAGLVADCILVLGAFVEGRSPSLILRDRLNRGIELYNSGASDRLLMSGDHGRKNYDEVNVMKQFAINAGVPSPHVFMDHAGFSTYESLYRARDIFKAKKIIITTQEYHLYRALYIAERLGLEAYGVAAADVMYPGQSYREFREMLARTKDFFYVIVKPNPTYLGESIPVDGDEDLTND